MYKRRQTFSVSDILYPAGGASISGAGVSLKTFTGGDVFAAGLAGIVGVLILAGLTVLAGVPVYKYHKNITEIYSLTYGVNKLMSDLLKRSLIET